MSGSTWPLDLHAGEVLKLPGETAISWAVFDADWYIRHYPEAVDDDPHALLDYYLNVGQRQGHSPNRLFDEQWHRKRYPQIAERVAAGEWDSAFDAYCRGGSLDRSPHWLFDELAYRDRYKDLTKQVLAEFQLINGYDHYLRHGMLEDRIGHVLFDPVFYLAHFDIVDVGAIRRSGAFQHYLDRIESDEPELRTSIYFDPAWYLLRYPEVAREIAAKRWKSALHHYICNETPSAFDPLEAFSESWYFRRDPGLRNVIASRAFSNGYMHFLRFGAAELRAPSDAIDLVGYAAQPAVKNDLQQGRAADAFTHWLTIGSRSGLRPAKPDTETVTSGQARHLSHLAATALLPIAGRFGYRFPVNGEPTISVVMVVRDAFPETMATIASLRYSTQIGLELIIVDRGSEDETSWIGQYVPDAKILRFDTAIKWSRAADAGRQLASAPAILFLSSHALIAPGSVDRAWAHLAAPDPVGAVGGMIVQAHGVIAQAGGILWRTGGAHDYQRDSSPLDPEVNFVRAVDFCSAGFLLVQAGVLTSLDGLDHECPDGYDAIDLCLRIAQAGFRVLYDPSVMITLADWDRPNVHPGAHFLAKHAAALEERLAPGGPPVQVFARHAGPHSAAPSRRLLFIEDTVPLRRLGSGFVRANDLVGTIASLGFAVTVFPVNGFQHDLGRLFGDFPPSVEVMHTLSLDRLGAFLAARPNYYDTVWVSRPHNMARARPFLERATRDAVLNARIVLDTEAVTPVRDAIRMALSGESYDLGEAMQAIREDAEICRRVVAVTPAEADLLRSHGLPHVSVIGHMIEPKPTVRPFAHRAGLLFVGAIHTEDSPNLDSLTWFADAVLPLIEAELKWETRLTIAGYTAPGIDLSRFERYPRITLRGAIADLAPLYNAHRIFVAPTRYAAGAPYKVLEAASFGLPIVATTMLRDELDWTEQEILAADATDPAGFAALIVSLYRDETAWQQLRDAALQRLHAEYGRDSFAREVASLLLPNTDGSSSNKIRLIPKDRLDAQA